MKVNWKGFKGTMHCFPKLQEPRYEMGPILMMTLACPIPYS